MSFEHLDQKQFHDLYDAGQKDFSTMILDDLDLSYLDLQGPQEEEEQDDVLQ